MNQGNPPQGEISQIQYFIPQPEIGTDFAALSMNTPSGEETKVAHHTPVTKRHTIFDLQDTKIAFAHLSDAQLKSKQRLFSLMSNKKLSSALITLASIGLKLNVPGVKSAIKATMFKQFCGGESLDDSLDTIKDLKKVRIETILDYSVEGGHSEADFDKTFNENMKMIRFAAVNRDVSFVALKLTGLGSSEILKKIGQKEALSAEENQLYTNLLKRVEKLCRQASTDKVKLFIDAEETWLQGGIDAITNAMMAAFNKQTPIVHTTIQMYRTDGVEKVQTLINDAESRGYILGLKLVRGAYMEKERLHAANGSYTDPIHSTKKDTDICYEDGMRLCLDKIEKVSICIASHNMNSCQNALRHLQEKGVSLDHPHLYFAQLLGMSDTLSFNLAAAKVNVSKYVPYGPVKDVFPYLTRRANENSSMKGQTSRELSVINTEMSRRNS